MQQNPEANILFAGDLNVQHPILGDPEPNIMGSTIIEELEHHDISIYNTKQELTHKSGSHLDLILGTTGQQKHLKTIQTHPTWLSTYNINSDHFPITFTCQFRDTQKIQPKYRTWNLNSQRWTKYTKILEKHFSQWEWRTINDIQSTYDAILKTWTKIATSTIGKKTIFRKPTPWWTMKIQKLCNKIKQISRRNQRKKQNLKLKQHHKKELQTLIKNKNKLIRKAKKRHTHIAHKILKEQPTNTTAFWKSINKYHTTQQHTIPTLKTTHPMTKQTIYHKTIDQKLNAIHKITQNPPQPTNPSPEDKLHYQTINNWYHKNINKLTQPTPLKQPWKHLKKFNETQNFTTTQYSKDTLQYFINKPIQLYELNNCINTLMQSKRHR